MKSSEESEYSKRNNEHVPGGKFSVTLVGYGRYGNYIGPKYAKPGFPWDIQSVVDPALTPQAFAETVLGRKRPNTSLHGSFSTWYNNYYLNLSEAQRAHVVVELALPANRVFEVALRFIEAGVKHLVLPKPVVDNEKDLHGLLSAISKHRVKAAVASQWFYSSIPKIIERDLKRLTSGRLGERFDLDRVTIDFSKENGHHIAPAPLCELPHALQILHSAGLLKSSQRAGVSGDEWGVTVKYDSPFTRRGIFAVAGMDYKRKASQVKIHPEWDYQERTLAAYGAGNEPLLWVDFWMKFSPSGDSVIHAGRYSTREPDGQVLSHGISEDLLQGMHEAIFRAFDHSYESFERSDSVLPLSRYREIGLEIAQVHDTWRQRQKTLDSQVSTVE